SPQKGSYKPWFNEVRAVIYGVKQQPASIALNGQSVKADYDARAQKLTLNFPNNAQGAELRLSCGAGGGKAQVCFAVTQTATGAE
ncbi:MAG: hypothetical protein JOZ44_04000, partial [Acidobacteria bacterium]|nr:hypothetical protein [Acidobacteriota bacterium]